MVIGSDTTDVVVGLSRYTTTRTRPRGRPASLVIVESAGRDPMTPIMHAARRPTRRGWS